MSTLLVIYPARHAVENIRRIKNQKENNHVLLPTLHATANEEEEQIKRPVNIIAWMNITVI